MFGMKGMAVKAAVDVGSDIADRIINRKATLPEKAQDFIDGA
jgi:hypothetical protein